MNPRFKNCLDRKQIFRDAATKGYVIKELEASAMDFNEAKDCLKRSQYKWATIQAYYSLFHASRALLYTQGYRERSHYCLIQAIKALFVDEGMLDSGFINAMERIKALREKADYELEYSKDGAEKSCSVAEEFLENVIELM